jgi:hypothetical protein
MKLKIKAAIAGVAALGSLLAVAPSAFADGDPSDCPSGYACMWVDIHYLTGGSRFTHLDTYLYRATLPATYDHEASSAYNNASPAQNVYFYKPQKCAAGGSRFAMTSPNGDSDFTNGSPSGNFNDAVRSVVYDSSSLIYDCQHA